MADNEALLAEYRSLRDEMQNLAKHVEQTMVLTVTATTGLISLGLTMDKWYLLLTPCLMLVPSILFVWDQMKTAIRIAAYVLVFIESEVPGLTWETRLRWHRSRVPDNMGPLVYAAVYMTIGVVPLVLAWICFVRSPHQDSWSMLTIAVTSAAILSALIILLRRGREYFPKAFEDNIRFWEDLKKSGGANAPNQ